MLVTTHEDGNLSIRLPDDHWYHDIAKGLGKRRWLPARKLWVFPPLLDLMDTVKKYMPDVVWDAASSEVYDKVVTKDGMRKEVAAGNFQFDYSLLENVPFKMPPREAQKKALLLGRDTEEFAYLMDQGTGKTKVILDDAAHNYRFGRIDCLVVISPNSVKTNWVNPDEDANDPDTWDQCTRHMAPDIPFIKAAWFASPTASAKAELAKLEKAIEEKSPKLLIFSINVDGISPTKAQKFLYNICRKRKTMIVVDESTRIGNHTSTRHKVAVAARKHCRLARIASGTPVIKSPLKAYGQFWFLNPQILGVPTYTEFKARHALINPNNKHHIIKYLNTEELSDKIAGCSFRVLKADCLDLDPKSYTKRLVYMTAEQKMHYDNMREEAITYLDSKHNVSATNVMTQMARLQQIVSGYLPIIDPDTKEQTGVKKICGSTPPKVQEAIDILEECDHKVIIWCRYRFEVKEMAEALKREGITHVTFFGDTPEKDRTQHRQRFLADKNLKVFVGQIQTGGIGLDLYTANTVIYLSNTFSTEDRLQSEDRAHRHGNIGGVNYIDLITPKTVDERIIKVLRANKELSDQIMKDGYQKWL
jgi:superfamily II DNA or RNA helicase